MPDRILSVFPVPEMMLDDVSTSQSLRGTVAVVIDVLRATTTITSAMAAGVTRVIPCLATEDAFNMRETLQMRPPGQPVLLGGERNGLPIEGFDLGNSPEDYTSGQVGGKTLVFSTTNGTRAMFRLLDADAICLACFNNADAVAKYLLDCPKILILCAGTDRRYTEEDMLLAGMLTERLMRLSGGCYALNTYAVAAKEQWNTSFPVAKRIGTEPIHPENLAQILRQSRGGKNLMQLGLGKDILAASRINQFDLVPKSVSPCQTSFLSFCCEQNNLISPV
ncbi:MAG: 2-phosphosulfolactate phosphatase [Planctomycetaceae bacterium]|nr:2-phosphosulfolactate phosphatase [Planctomycetaceae bacterium]